MVIDDNSSASTALTTRILEDEEMKNWIDEWWGEWMDGWVNEWGDESCVHFFPPLSLSRTTEAPPATACDVCITW